MLKRISDLYVSPPVLSPMVVNYLFEIASSPGLSPTEERPGTYCLCKCEIFRYICHKKALCTYLVYMWKNTELSLKYTPAATKQKGNKSICQEGTFLAAETLTSLCTRLVAAPSQTQLAFTTETVHDKALANSELPGESVTPEPFTCSFA